jgi:protocatechuate 3,4-dioxygenase beta subunit
VRPDGHIALKINSLADLADKKPDQVLLDAMHTLLRKNKKPVPQPEGAETCSPSPLREFGPFYKPGSPYKSTVCEYDPRVESLGYSIAMSTFSRTYFNGSFPLVVRGVVKEGQHCALLPGAEVEAYQSHQFGVYGNLNPLQGNGFCRGVVLTNDQGQFEFRSYLPGSYGVLAGLSPLGPSVDLPPFVDRHIHMAVWAKGHEVLITQLLFNDDKLLGSSVRGVPHGYDGGGLVVSPTWDAANEVWVAEGVELVLPREKRPERLKNSRAEAAEDYCQYSLGDLIVPSLCMPKLAQPTGPVPPSWLFELLLPGTLYIWLPSVAILILLRMLRVCFKQVPSSLLVLIVALVFGVILTIVQNVMSTEHNVTNMTKCLLAFETQAGASVVGTPHGGVVEYWKFGSTNTNATRVVIQHGSAREGGVFKFFDELYKKHNLAVIAPSLPGFGCSSAVPGRFVGDWPHIVKSILEKEGWLGPQSPPFVVIGYSFGGAHALSLQRLSMIM